MKLSFDDITNKHRSTPCVVALHGPSLDLNKEQIQDLQKKDKVIRVSVNEWYDFFKEKPDYWIVSNGEFTIDASIRGGTLWDYRGYPRDVFNKYNVPLFYNITADLTSEDMVSKHLKCDYLPYDTRHFRGHTCIEILKNFRSHFEENKNLDFRLYGNNPKMWAFPNVDGFSQGMKELYGRVGGGWSTSPRCCGQAGMSTLQERLQSISGHPQHASPGHTVGLFAIMFAVIMGCSPIYVAGLDLDCSIGFARGANERASYNSGHMGHWKKIFRDFLLDDMRIINESAKILGIEIINLNKSSWHDSFLKGRLDL